MHVQKYVGELDTPLAEGSFQSHDTLWFFQGALNTSASTGDTLSDAPLIHAPFSRDQVIPQPPDLGTKVMVRLSYAAPTGPATGKPKITGTAQVGQTLTAGTSGISDPDGNMKAENGDAGFAYTYQWYRVDAGAETEITGARGRGSTYTLVQADEGKTFRVEVHFTDDADNGEGPLKSNEYPAGAEKRRATPGGRCERRSRAAWRCSTTGSGARCATTAWTTRATRCRRWPACSRATRTASGCRAAISRT